MLTRSRRRFTAAGLLALAGMLFFQAAIGLASCQLPVRTAAKVIAAAQAEHSQMAKPRHEADRDAHLCVARCGSRDQSFGKGLFNPPDLAGPTMPFAKRSLAVITRWEQPQLLAAGPPARILFQSFLL